MTDASRQNLINEFKFRGGGVETLKLTNKQLVLSPCCGNDCIRILSQSKIPTASAQHGTRPPKTASSVFASLTHPFPFTGRPRSLNLHSRRQSCSLPTISPRTPLSYWRPSGLFPQTGRLLHSAYNGRSGQCAIRLPTPGRTFPSSHHESAIQHPARYRQFAPFRPGGDDGMHERIRRTGDFAECVWIAERFWWAGYVGLPGEFKYWAD